MEAYRIPSLDLDSKESLPGLVGWVPALRELLGRGWSLSQRDRGTGRTNWFTCVFLLSLLPPGTLSGGGGVGPFPTAHSDIREIAHWNVFPSHFSCLLVRGNSVTFLKTQELGFKIAQTSLGCLLSAKRGLFPSTLKRKHICWWGGRKTWKTHLLSWNHTRV